MKYQTAIVTGGCGFIGSHLTDLLLNHGIKVTVIDNMSTGRRLNLDHQKDNNLLRIIEADISDYQSIESYFKGIDCVFHMAALADIVPSIKNPMEYHRSNVDGTVNVLQASVKHQIKRFLYTASSSCYGIPNNYPTRESDEMRPQYPYALTKMVGEEYALHFGKLYNLPLISLRLFNVYGPRSRTSGTYGAVFGVFLKQKLSNKPFTVVGDGTQSRDFTYVTDVADAFYTAAISDIENEVFNVGSGDHYSVNRLTELLGGEVTFIPKRPGEPGCTFADTSKIKEKLNWSAKISFEAGVEQVLSHIDYWQEAPLWDKDSINDATKDWFKYLGKDSPTT